MSIWLTLITAAAGCYGIHSPLIAAHRGGLYDAIPENTMPAFQQAQRLGVQFVELDIRATADGELVVLHDRSVARTTNGSGPIDGMMLAEARLLDAGANQRIPTLAEVLAWAAPLDVGLLLDVKRAKSVQHRKIVAAVDAAGLRTRVLFGVRSIDDLAGFSRHDAGLRFLGLVPRRAAIDDFVAAGVEAIRLWPRWLRAEPELAAALRSRRIAVWVTAGGAQANALRNLADLGVQGLIVDRPGLARSVFDCASKTSALQNSPSDTLGLPVQTHGQKQRR